MLSNEKYKGEALLQKTYTTDFLTKKRVENDGAVPQYYVEESHPAIVDKEIWEAVQLEMERRKMFSEKYGIKKLDYAAVDNPFAGRVICGCCGRAYGRKVWNSTNERLRRVVWRCNRKYEVKGSKGCENRHIADEVLCRAFVSAFNSVIKSRDFFMSKWKRQTQEGDALSRLTARRFIDVFKATEPIEEFVTNLYFKIVEKIVVYKDRLVVGLLDGSEMEFEI